VVLILGISLALRLVNLDALIVSDEMRWTCRSLRFRKAILEGDWPNTFRVGHPGVVTTWLGAAFIPGSQQQAQEVCQVTDEAKRLYLAGETSREVSQRLAGVGELLFAGRVGVAVGTWVCIVIIFLLTRRLCGAEAALAALILVALSPFSLAHSRFLHLDAMLTGLMNVSVLSLLAALQRRDSRSARRRWAGNPYLWLSGVAGGMAVLQKSPAMSLAPFTALVLAIDVLRRGVSRETVRCAVRDLALWGTAAVVVFVALWPTMWVDPLGTMTRVLDKAVGYAEEGHTLGNYFMGRPVLDPGWAFYPTAVLFRLSPLSFFGLLAGVGWLARGQGQADKRNALLLLLYGVLFSAFMGLGAKKFDRYILPVFPALEIVAGLGLVWPISIVRERLQEPHTSLIAIGGTVLALALQLGLTVPHGPHYLTTYNPVLGGTRRAKDVLLTGWGEGYGEVISYLNDKPNAEDLQVAVGRFSGFAPLFRGEPRTNDTYSVWETDYVVNYLSQVQRRRNQDILEEYFFNPEAEPEYVVTLGGVDYLWIYPNVHYVEPVRAVTEQAQSDQGDCLLVNGDSLFAKHYRGDLPTYTFSGQWNPAKEAYTYSSTEQVARLVSDMTSACHRVWYARYPKHEPDDYVGLLDSQGLLLEREAYPHMEILLYQLAEPSADQPLDLQYGSLRLLAYGPMDPPPAWGRDGGIWMAWEAVQPVEEDYSTFLHLYDAHGHRIAQGDALLVDETLRPTSQWEPEIPKVALYHLAIPPGTAPGQYELAVGAYDIDTGHRLPLLGAGEGSDDKSARLQLEVGVPDQVPPATALDVSHYVERDITPQLRLLGYRLEHEAILAGNALPIRLAWKALAPMEQDYQVQLELRGRDGIRRSAEAFQPVTTDYPSSQWTAGEHLQEWYYLPVDEGVPTGEMTLILSLLDQDGQPVQARPVTVASVWIQSRESSFEIPGQLGEPRTVNLGDKITFLGYDVEPTVRAGEDLRVTVTWQARQDMEESYKTFVHLYGGDGSIVAQQDRVPGLGARPTTTWEKGEVVQDRLLVPIESATPVGTYQLAIGLYDQATGGRLATYDADGQRLDKDRILLEQVEIKP
jgi:4-amino-4-deoxy-L-arabinose transferase-like glycosyltransferase